MKNPVLIVGGTGIVGSQTAKTLRRLHPELPMALGGRDLRKADALAREIGGPAFGVAVDLRRRDLGLPGEKAFSAVAMFLKDETFNSLRYAQDRGAAYLGISTGIFEMAPEIALYAQKPARAPILMASQWLAGAAVLPALVFARAFRKLETIELAAHLDEEDMGGPAAYADFERLTKVGPNALILDHGKWVFARGDDAKRRFLDVDGVELEGSAYSPFDVSSLAAATDAHSIRFDLAVGKTASRRRGEPFSTEIIIEMRGELADGTPGRVRHELVHPAGQAPVTALAVAVGVERLLGLDGGERVAPGLYLPEVLIEPEYMVRRLKEFGVQFRNSK
ncbi:NAD(P)-dependent oxidoreductase [Pendulispora rubella]|uniref:NAD(P)-dependent oxidoreductase n=1 Tax=Pendulispora rubella TaxID=2741070 RepID=A0ABZ2KVS5_9BACT